MPDSDYIVSDGEIITSRTGDRMWTVPAGVICDLPAGSVVTIKAGLIVIEGTINGVGMGYGGEAGPGAGTYLGGAGHGGYGGNDGGGYGGGPPYGDPTDDTVYLGSGGGGIPFAGAGGGAIALYAPFVILSGVIDVSGENGSDAGGGSGGTILIEAHRVVFLGGALYARGGSGTGYGGGGAGGRIKIRAFELIGTPNYDVSGGSGGGDSIHPGSPGQSGTYQYVSGVNFRKVFGRSFW